jgi:ElaB/YqjD/DUF883 family membrane-anchored ribosome-binding protein
MGSKYGKGVQEDLQSLREDMSDLASQLTDALGGEEIADDMKQRFQQISDNIDEALSQAGSKGREVARQTGADAIGDKVENSIREHPFASLAIAIGVGALVGSQLRR